MKIEEIQNFGMRSAFCMIVFIMVLITKIRFMPI